MKAYVRTSMFFLLLLIWVAFLISGCKKAEDNPITTQEVVLDDDDAANSVAGAMGGSISTNGFSAQVENAVKAATGGSVGSPVSVPFLPEAVLFDTTITKTKTSATYSYNYVISYSYNFSNLGNICNFSYTSKGTYETPRIGGTDTANCTMTVKNITNTSATNYSLTGNFQRRGSSTSKIGNKTSFYSSLALSLDSITVSKSTKQINGGSATIIFNGSTSTGKTFSKTATIQFLGNTQFKLLLNGKEYLIDPATAFANKN